MEPLAAPTSAHSQQRPGYFVRYGAMGQLGVFFASQEAEFSRGTQVVVRSVRGLECGQVLAPCQEADAEGASGHGEILRRMSVEDHLLLARTQQRRTQALRRCEALLEQHGVPDVLIDAEYLLDGNTLVFYFLGETSPRLKELLGELACEFEAQVRFQDFLHAAEVGCGPECGTERAGGCTSCHQGCALAAACPGSALPKSPPRSGDNGKSPPG